jgi:two-component system, LytTR family, sensor kinase
MSQADRSLSVTQEYAADRRTGTFPVSMRELAVILAFWLMFALVTFANRTLDPRRPSSDGDLWAATLTISMTQAMLWAALTVPLFVMAARAIGGRQHRVASIALLVLSTLVAVVLVSSIVDFVREAVLPMPRRGGGFGAQSHEKPWWSFSLGGFQFINDMVIAMGVIAGGVARAYSVKSRARQEQATRLAAQLSEARLEALRRQLDPHFLFNTLHAVSSLVERDPRGVRRMISRLSELLRHSIEDADEPEIPLSRELELLTQYVEIMQVRFQGRLTITTNVPPETADALVPNMILQPLVENAIKHGVEQVTGEGHIALDVSRADGQLVVQIRDNGPGLGSSAATRTSSGVGVGVGVGVRNTIARLEQLYGRDQSFTLRGADGGGTVAEVRLPFHTASDLRTVGLTTMTTGVRHG